MRKIPNISFTTTNNLCTGCGICVGVCPTSSISMEVKNGRFLPKINDSTCINSNGCHKCNTVCPGLAVDFKAISEKIFPTTSKHDNLIGNYQECFTGFSTKHDLRYHGASGGTITQLLIWLLETGKIDGAVVTKFDSDRPLLVNTFIATSTAELISAKGSKYAPVTLDQASKLIKESECNKIVVVGLPCHIEGLRKQAETDKIIRSKILAYFGLFCSCGRTFYLSEHIFKEHGIPSDKLTYLAYRDEGCLGSMVARWNSCGEEEIFKIRYQDYFHPLRSFFIPKRCIFCIDHYARLADISFGDIHIPPYSDDKIGINSIVARTPQMVEWLKSAQKDGVLSLEHLDPTILNKSQTMAHKKYNRVGAFMKTAKMFGSKIPVYDLDIPVFSLPKNSVDYIQTRCQQFIGSHKSLWPLISVLKSKPPKN